MDQQLVKDKIFFFFQFSPLRISSSEHLSWVYLLSWVFFFLYIPFNERSLARRGLSIARQHFQGSATNVIILHIHIHCVWLYSFDNKKSNYNSRYCIIPISHAFFFFIIEPGKFTNMTNREYRKCNHE